MWQLVIIGFFVGLALGSGPTAASTENGRQLALVINAIEGSDWTKAKALAGKISNSSAKVYADWRRLRDGEGSWNEYVRFVKRHSDWPGLPLLRKVGETKIPYGRPSEEILAYFDNELPQTGRGALRLAEAFRSSGNKQAADEVITLAWLTLYLSQSERETFYRLYKKLVSKHVWTRADNMVWDGSFNQALALRPYLTAEQLQLLQTRVALRRGKNRVNKMIDALPKNSLDNPGLAYDRFRWRLRKDIWDTAGDLILERSTSRADLGRPEIWADRRSMITRRFMRDRAYQRAYDIASRHHLRPDESGFVDLEWLSGYLQLIYLNDPEKAVEHFRRLRDTAVTPISQGRIWYWLGRAHEADTNVEKAREAYAVAAKFQTSFYGQLAAERAGIARDTSLGDPGTANWKDATFLTSTVFQAGKLLQQAGEHYEAGRFFAHMAETMDQADQIRLGQFLLDLNEPNMALRVAKNGARMGRVNINSYYPVTELTKLAGSVPPELVMAVARQESELNQNVESPAGAQGIMQVMPLTAKAMAKKLDQTYSFEKLKTDWEYNTKLGVAYLAEMLRRYDGSYVLTAAAYNAGPQRVDRWIREHGDPRRANTNTEQWIEKIQFRETRNYVQRVLEGIQVYRARITGDATTMVLAKDLERGG